MTNDPPRLPSDDLEIVRAYSGTAREKVGYLLLSGLVALVAFVGAAAFVA